MPSEAKHILVVEDDAALAQWVADFLISAGFVVSVANRGDVAVDLILSEQPDLVLLDVMLPGLSGLQVCQTVRANYNKPIVMLTACAEENDEVEGLHSGADDYLAKPVRPRILLARIQALLRRETLAEVSVEGVLRIGCLTIDSTSRSVSLDNEDVILNANEFDLLWLLANSAGEVLDRGPLIETLQGYDYDGFSRAIDVRVSRLRRKLKDNLEHPKRIKTIRNKGYLLTKDAW